MNSLAKKLSEPVDSLPLNIFRILFGLFTALQFYTFHGTVSAYAVTKFHMTYDFFHWIRPISGMEAQLLYAFFILCSVFVSIGILYRPASVVVFLGLLYSFLVDKTLYNNHYYLFILIAFLLVFSDAHKGLSLRSGFSTSSVPRWMVWSLQFQICIVYFFGGINKLNYDWLVYFEPVYSWLPDMLGSWIVTLPEWGRRAIAGVFVYSGLLIDLAAGMLLLTNYRSKYFLFPFLILFHLFNSIVFEIGLFPWFSISALILFIPSQHLKKLVPFVTTGAPSTHRVSSAVSVLLLCWIGFQLLFPLRHWLIDGWYLWDERGLHFAWTMKLRDKEPIMAVSIKVNGSPELYYIPIHEFLSKRQAKHIAYRPVDMVRFAHFIKGHYGQKLKKDIEVYAEVFVCLNHYRPYQLIINPYVDLSEIEVENRIYFGTYDWIVPLGNDPFHLRPPVEILQQRNW
jgi:vitamin K-dependent gamma-carboxylase